jgi:uncharacterized RDD family membrane protein YckC
MLTADQDRVFPAKSNVDGAGFWVRLAAFAFDYAIVALPIGYVAGDAIGHAYPAVLVSFPPSSPFWQALTFVLMLAYYTGFEASPMQATPGKFVCGLAVVSDPDLGRVPVHRAAGRFLAMCFPFLPLISACTIAWGKGKRGVHDGAASSIVMRRVKLVRPVMVTGDTKQCPMCAESVQVAAKVCRFCQHRFDRGGGHWVLRTIVFLAGAISVGLTSYAMDAPPTRQSMSYSLSSDTRQNTYLHFKGEFAANDVNRLVKVIHDNSPQFVTFDSPGGSVADAMAMGRAIRAAGISTFIEPNASCVSACFLAFIGGVRRYASDKATLGVHQSSFPSPISFGTAASHIESLKDYIVEMGVAPEVLDIALETPADKMHYFKANEAASFNIATVVPSAN